MSRTAKKLITALVMSAGPPLVALALQRYFAQPDAFRTLGMRGSLLVKRVADVQVTAWQKVSATAATSYQRARL